MSSADVIVINEQTGVLTVNVPADLAGEGGKEYSALVYAKNQSGGETEIEVTIAITNSCSTGTAVPNPGLVADCKTQR